MTIVTVVETVHLAFAHAPLAETVARGCDLRFPEEPFNVQKKMITVTLKEETVWKEMGGAIASKL